tara:strand:- start:31542 stop:31859 length:318 start_codon:yes stop_codon:yes gene_type:complete
MQNTQNLADFGQIEREEASTLLRTLGSLNDDTKHFGDNGVVVEFNPMSGNVFLVDEDCNVAMMNGHQLEDFHTCFNCGGEGLASDFREDNHDECCQKYADELGLE